MQHRLLLFYSLENRLRDLTLLIWHFEGHVRYRTGLPQPEAEKRVTEVTNQVKSDLDTARKNAAQLALWLTAALIIGAFSACLAATEGGDLRDGRWGTRSLRARTT